MTKQRTLLFLTLLLFNFLLINAQETFRINGASNPTSGKYLLTNAHIVSKYDASPIFGYLLIENGKVIATGTGNYTDKDAVTIDLKGSYIYPAFIDLFSTYGVQQAEKMPSSPGPQMESNQPGAYAWNQALHPEFRANELFVPNSKDAEMYVKNGFAAVLTAKRDGLSRGSGALVSLANKPAHEAIFVPQASHEMSFQRGTSTQYYPTSLMGAIALIRQTFYDAQWYASGKSKEYNVSLEKWNQLESMPILFEANSWLNVLRAQKIAAEFNKKIIVKGGGNEYQRADEIKAANIPLILPLTFPEAFDVTDVIEASNLSLSELKHWELAPKNAAILAQKGIEFTFTMEGLKDKSTFLSQIKKTVSNGLTTAEALKALTYTPAVLFGQQNNLGSLEKGKWANFIVTDQPLFNDASQIYQCWVQGVPTYREALPDSNKIQEMELVFQNKTFKTEFVTEDKKTDLFLFITDTSKIKTNISIKNQWIAVDWKMPEDGVYRLSGWKNNNGFSGKGKDAKGNDFDWTLTAKSIKTPDIVVDSTKSVDSVGSILFPFTAFGFKVLPTAKKVLFKNVTIWTNEDAGILEGQDVLIDNGKIVAIGKNLSPAGAEVIDGTGKHLTNGIIDEHSHISIEGGVNEAGWASTAEVRIGDVITDYDINMYRQLAGGVIGAQLLHGSANPIGGQAALVKFRWGKAPEALKWEGADGFIKFALGENVKQSNWGDLETVRFPQTRMGVEQVYMDFFSRAQAYAATTDKRKDLGLEALSEILQKKRFITCHSYVQSEINMLMKVAERFNFKINTFTHILEGYKVADIMKKHGCGASTFSDWWGYKYEVIEAIPYNAAILNEVGVVTAINSDDAEMARRLNQEAAKSIKFGNVSEEDAWKMVTLNPAKLLHVDQQTGSIKVGKSADLVLWSANPLSIYATPILTYVDGICYFDIKRDIALKQEAEAEKNRIIQKMLAEIQKGAPSVPIVVKKAKEYHCEDIETYVGETGY
jgi:imidazolonepropionase-like amidohydrolase